MTRLLLLFLATAIILLNQSDTNGGEIQFVEDFVLAEDRTEALEQLIPGTDVYYFYQSLHLQNTQRFDEVEKLLKQWQQRHGQTQTLRQIRHRQMLLTYASNPKQTIDYLIQQISPNLGHQQDQLASKPKLPTSLDQKSVSYETLKKNALRRHKGVQGFSDLALDLLLAEDLDPTRRRELLSRLTRPTHPQLVDLVLADLQHKGSRGFGSLSIHQQLLLEQLDELITRRPQIENQGNFVNAYLTKLQPNPDVDWQNDPQELEAYLSRLWTFVGKLNPAHNSLKAHVLYNWLVLDEKQGQYNRRRFLDYLSLPRSVSYIEPRLLQDAVARRHPVDLNLNPGNVTNLPPIFNDEPLVRRYLLHFLQSESSFNRYAPYVRDEYLQQVFAEAKITQGLGNPEQWYSLLPPAQYQQLKDRVDLDFAPTNPQVFRDKDPVQLDLFVKNVDKLIVKVYEVNTQNFYRRYGREVNTDIELDGLIANHEVTYEYSEAPEIRKQRHFEFDELQKPGVYVIDFIGNGKSSRAVIRKGELHYLEETTAYGHLFTVLDDDLQPVTDATLWMAGQHFTAEDDGRILVPFSSNPGRQSIILSHNGLSSLHFFEHKGEAFRLKVAAFIDRESLLPQQEAVVMLRSDLRIGDRMVTSKVLSDVSVTIRSRTIDGIEAEKQFDDVKLVESSETPLVFFVPDRLASIHVEVNAKVEQGRKTHSLSDSHSISINGIQGSEHIDDVHLVKVGDTYLLQLLGKTGETRAHRPLRVQLQHRLFTDPVILNFATDENGNVTLSGLDDVQSLQASGPNTKQKSWQLFSDRHTEIRVSHALEGELIQIPHMHGDRLQREDLSLFEMRGGRFASDASNAVRINEQFVELKGLKAGNYSLEIDGSVHRIRVTQGAERASHAMGDYRRLEKRQLKPLQLTSIQSDEAGLQIQVANPSKFTRVHVYASHFVPAFDSFSTFSKIRESDPVAISKSSQRSYYMAGRLLGDELKYVLERAYATKFPGNMLERPTLLLNSWPMRSTETTTQTARGGEVFNAADVADEEALMESAAQARKEAESGNSDFANLDFLGASTLLVANLTPDDDGRITIPRKDLGPHHHFHVIAVDPLTTVYRSLALDKLAMPFRDLRLADGLDPEKHYTQQKSITPLQKGEVFELADITSGRFDTYDSLASVYSLLLTLSNDETLGKFDFLTRWPQLTTEEKQEKYSEYACHELNFFVYKKDPDFFREVVEPYLANKQHKTFLDYWLLEYDLTPFLQPWEYAQLNTAERLLLGERIDGESDRVKRLIDDLFSLQPQDVGEWNLWFESAILGKSLEADADKFGLLEERAKALSRKGQLGGVARFAAPSSRMARPMAAGGDGYAGGGFGGRGLGEDDSIAMDAAAAPELKSESRERLMRRRYSGNGVQLDGARAANSLTFEMPDRARRQLYEKLEKTQEWAENNYWRLPIEQQIGDLVQVNAFWHDYAQHKKDEPFFSINWPTATSNFTEMVFALSLLDLPFEGSDHTTNYADGRMTLTSGSPMIVFHEQIKETASMDQQEGDAPMLITQNFFRADDRYRMVGGVRQDKFVTDEFLSHVVYGCQIVLTNPTSTPRRVQLLTQIPLASMPAKGSKSTSTVNIDLGPFQTQTQEYFFYFPSAGEFAHFPAHVAMGETLLAHADANTMKVVDKPTNVDTKSWDYVSQFASHDEVIDFLDQNNVHELNLDRIAFRMIDRRFFTRAITLLKERHAYSATLWAYGLKHNDKDAIATWLKQEGRFLSQCGQAIESDLVTVDPVVRRTYQHLDYKPLVNARSHQLGSRRQILNDRFHNQYHALLNVLAYRRELNSEDRMALTYYLLLQDRIEEAIKMFAGVQRSNLETQIQYDYFAAYLDCFREEPVRARQIVSQYVSYPVPKWQKAFANVRSMLDELDGKGVEVVDEKDRTQSLAAAAAAQANFEFVVEDREIRIDYQNVSSMEVRYYLIDLELLFSSSPFVQQLSGTVGQFSHIRPNDSVTVELSADQTKHVVPVPEKFHNQNLLIECVADGITRSQAYFSNSLTVQMSENYGQMKVTDAKTSRPVSKTYVKVYAELKDGRTVFYKDGYTDLRGRFDYTSLSTNQLDFVKRFSLLVLDTERGGMVREATPPKR